VSLWGGLLKLGYRLSWHRIGSLALGYWPLLMGLLWLGVPWLVEAHLPGGWPYALALSAVGLVLVIIMLVSRRQKYVRFRQDESLAAHLSPDVVPIRPDEKIPVRATGVFEVRDKRQHFVAAPADFATMETREHIVMARIPLSRMWLVAQSPKDMVGWWYAFAKPADIRSIQTGWLHHGFRPWPTLRLVYLRRRLTEGKRPREVMTEETVYLSVAKRFILHRLLENLARDAGQPVEYEPYVPL